MVCIRDSSLKKYAPLRREGLIHKNDIDEETLNEIDKTTIIKLPNDKAYKISPVRKQKKSNLKKDKFLFEE